MRNNMNSRLCSLSELTLKHFLTQFQIFFSVFSNEHLYKYLGIKKINCSHQSPPPSCCFASFIYSLPTPHHSNVLYSFLTLLVQDWDFFSFLSWFKQNVLEIYFVSFCNFLYSLLYNKLVMVGGSWVTTK